MAVDLTRDGRRVRSRAGSSAGGQVSRKGEIRGGAVVVVGVFLLWHERLPSTAVHICILSYGRRKAVWIKVLR